jgi:hypothetical protein
MGLNLGRTDGNTTASKDVDNAKRMSTVKKKFDISNYIVADSLDESEESIIASMGIPLYTPGVGGVCMGHDVKEVTTVRHPITGVTTVLYEVTAKFDSRVDEEQSFGIEDPTQQEPDISWDSEEYEELVTNDTITGEKIQTKAKEPIVMTREGIRPILIIERYEEYPFPPIRKYLYEGRINAEPFWGAPRLCVLLKRISARKEIVNQQRLSRVRYEFRFKFGEFFVATGDDEEDVGTYTARPLHQGTQYLQEVGGEPVKAKDAEGNEITVNLDEDGLVLPTKDRDGNLTEEVYLTFNKYLRADFNDLGFTQ